VRRILEDFALRALWSSGIWAHYHDLCVQKRSWFLRSSDAFWKFSLCEVYKKFWEHYHNSCVQKRSCLSRSSDIFWKFSLCEVYKKLWKHFHDLCVQKRSYLSRSSDAFWKFSPCKLHEESYGRIFTIFASKNEVVCCWVPTHFRSSLPVRFTEKVMGAFSRFIRSKVKLFPAKFRRISEVFTLRGSWKVLGALSQLLRPKTFCTKFHDLCATKRRCLLWSSHTFWKFFACKVYRKSYGCIITIYASKNEAVSCEVQTHFGSSPPAKGYRRKLWVHFHDNKQTFLTSTFCKKPWPRFTILRAHQCLLCCSDTLWRSWLSHFIRRQSFESEHIWTTTARTNCDMRVWPYAKQFQKKSWTGTSDMFGNIWTLKEWTDFVKFDLR